MVKRVFMIVLDSFGIGELPDAADFGDVGTNTLRSAATSPEFAVPNMQRLGLGNICGVDAVAPVRDPIAAFGRMAELSAGKDTTTGHLELCGLVSPTPMPTYPNGFPDYIIEKFKKATGRGVLCNKPYSGTEVIRDYGREHVRTGDLIVYTSADSVFQVAAHEDVVPLPELYRCCEAARAILSGKDAVGRVIARPFTGEYPNYTRTAGRHDFSLKPHGRTLLDELSDAELDVIGVGKISDIFAGVGITESFPDKGNPACISRTLELAKRDFHGLCFVNLVDFDMLYGHRNDTVGYGRALTEFDRSLDELLPLIRDDDMLILTADHGCDPGFKSSTDHSREYVPLLVYGSMTAPHDIGTCPSFTAVADIVRHALLG